MRFKLLMQVCWKIACARVASRVSLAELTVRRWVHCTDGGTKGSQQV